MKKMDPVVIGFYKNGLIIQGFPFYPYSSKEAQVIGNLTYFCYLLY